MRIFINLFLLAFAADALMSSIDDWSQLLFGGAIFGLSRELLALAVFCLSPVVYLATGIDSRLPKSLLLPPALYAVWAGLGCLPFSIYSDKPGFMPALSLLQLALAAYAFAQVRTQTGRWLLPREYFARPALRLKNSLWFALANVALVPPALALLLTASAWLYLEHKTAGFMQLGIDGLRLQQRHYARAGKTVHLIAMMHIGSARYYRELGEFLSTGNAVVLAEGISDDDGLIANDPSYSRLAEFIGLDSQERMEITGRPLDYDDLATRDDADASGPGVVRADVDSREFSEQTRRYIEHVDGLFNPGDTFLQGLSAYLAWYRENMTPEKEAEVFLEIIDKRNATLLQHLDRALLGYDVIAVPWGALHMPGLERALLERGFSLAATETRLAVGFSELFGGGAE
jgi:hypothetical protein